MGSFCQSFHFRTDDRDAVIAAARAIARKEDVELLVAKSKGGWINVYAANDVWHPRHAAAISKACKAEHSLLFYLHDSDIVFYWYHRKGVLKDRFMSCPDYFGKAKKSDMLAVGNPDAFSDLLTAAAARKQLKKLVSGRIVNGECIGECPDLEDDRLEALARLFGVTGAMTSFEALQEGEKIKGLGGLNDMKLIK